MLTLINFILSQYRTKYAKLTFLRYFDANHVCYNKLKSQAERELYVHRNLKVFIIGHYCIITGHFEMVGKRVKNLNYI